MSESARRSVHVKLFAGARQLAGADELTIDLPAGGTVGELRDAMARLHPDMLPLLRRARFAVNCEFASDETTVPASGDVAIIPPVSGG